MNYESYCTTIDIPSISSFSNHVQTVINKVLKDGSKRNWTLHSISQEYIPERKVVNVIFIWETN